MEPAELQEVLQFLHETSNTIYELIDRCPAVWQPASLISFRLLTVVESNNGRA